MVTAKRGLAAALILLTLTLTGCVYLRLLQLKLQLRDFDRNFDVQTTEGLTLTMKNPVLLDDDIEEFFHWRPETRKKIGSAERWEFRWTKDRVSADGDRQPVELSFDLLFVEHKLTKLHVPETFFVATVPKRLAISSLRSLGGARVDKARRTAESTIGSDALAEVASERFLSEDGIKAALGEPMEVVADEARPKWHYRFHPVSPQQRLGETGLIEVTFTFEAATHRVWLMDGKTAFGRIIFDTTQTGPKAR
jgi:hypothetical protein